MKNTVTILLLSAIVSSCTSTQYYQLYKTTPSNLKVSKDNLCYEDNHVKIFYNLWAEKGNPGFIFYNKTDSIITLNKDLSFYVQNGFSYDYFQNRIYSISSNYTDMSSQAITNSHTSSNQTSSSTTNGRSASGLSSFNDLISINSTLNSTTTGKQSVISNTQTNSINQGTSFSRGSSITINEQNKIKIAPHSGKLITEFTIVNSRYKNCDFGTSQSIKFTEENSPLRFSNVISYELNGKVESVVNSFFVNEISNLSFEEFNHWQYDTICGKPSSMGKIVPKLTNPNWFYIEYHY